jgi:pimeloyl-ACP methyl ester carboxylesterase
VDAEVRAIRVVARVCRGAGRDLARPASSRLWQVFGRYSAGSVTTDVLFLPGAGGAAGFWQPVATRLPDGGRKTLLSWPGAGNEPRDPQINSYGDLVGMTAGALDDQADLVAQSMGGVVAAAVALEQRARVRRLVLVATSGGLDVSALGGADWRADYRREFPGAAPWIWEEQIDLTARLTAIHAPTLLLWGDADPIAPVAVGRRLAELLPNSTLEIVPGGTHAMAAERPDEIAQLIAHHLAWPVAAGQSGP